jgi:antitoxin (DNA-binding transcriptional repressor) of toxin-antitoxin stability system
MVTKPKEVELAEASTNLPSLVTELKHSGRAFVLTESGKPVAKVVPIDSEEPVSLKGSILYMGDVISPIDEKWDADT